VHGAWVLTATHCNTLQHTATHFPLQHTATHCNTLQRTSQYNTLHTKYCNTLQHTATHRSHGRRCCYRLPANISDMVHRARVLTATHCNNATYCNTLQHTSHGRRCGDRLRANVSYGVYGARILTATHCNTLQHNATHQSWAPFWQQTASQC